MTGAAIFLVTRTMKNLVKRSILRLRQPRYLLGAIVFLGYFFGIVGRKSGLRNIAARHAEFNEVAMLIVSVLALIIILAVWALPSTAPGLFFTETEIQFFFAGPVTRRQLLAYKILRSQMQTLFSAAFFSLFAFRGSHFLGLWIALAVMDVYMMFASFARARLKLAGVGWLGRLAILSTLLTILYFTVSAQVRSSTDLMVRALSGPRGAIGHAIATIAATPPLSTILYVPHVLASAVYGPSPLVPSLITLALGFALFFLTTQFDTSFEDASIVASQRALARRARVRGMRSGSSTAAVNRMPAPFKLSERGRPEVALIWKNMIGAIRISAFPFFIVLVPLVLAATAGVFHTKRGAVEAVGMMGLMMTALFVFLGPQTVRTDLRTDILRLDVIKTYPISAESLLIGELGASLILVSIFEIVMLLASVSILQFGSGHFNFFTTPEFIVSALVFLIPVCAIQLLIQNGAVILFPAWNLQTDNTRFSAIGQRVLVALGSLMTLGFALLPAGLVFLPSFWLVHKLMGTAPIGVLISTLPAAAILVAEIFIAHRFLASQFEDIDIANDVDSV